jgi:hypothetical protein
LRMLGSSAAASPDHKEHQTESHITQTTTDEVLGEYREVLGVPQAEEAKASLRKALEVVLDSGYRPASPLTEAAASRSLDELAPENPVAAELGAIREALEEVRQNVAPRSVLPASTRAEIASMRSMIESLVSEGRITEEDLAALIDESTSDAFDNWVDARKFQAEKVRNSRPRSKSSQFSDEPPF